MAFQPREGIESGICRNCSTLKRPHDGSCNCDWGAIANAAGPAEDVGQTVVEKPERIPECSECSKSLTDKDATHADQFGYGHNQCTTCAHKNFMEQGDVNPVKGCSECRKLGGQMSGWSELGRAGTESAEPSINLDDEAGSEWLDKQLMTGEPTSEPTSIPIKDDKVRMGRAIGRKTADTTAKHPHGGVPDKNNCTHCSNAVAINLSHIKGKHDSDMNPNCYACQSKQISGTLI